jgi:hypothetical protein
VTDDRVATTTELLLAAARERDMRITGDGRVSESDLEQLLGYSERYLRQLREEGKAPPCYRLNGRPSYRICDAAAWIEAGRESW